MDAATILAPARPPSISRESVFGSLGRKRCAPTSATPIAGSTCYPRGLRPSGMCIVGAYAAFGALGTPSPIQSLIDQKPLACDAMPRSAPLSETDPGKLARSSSLARTVPVRHG